MTDQMQRLQDLVNPQPNTHPTGSDEWWDAHMRDKVRQWYASQPKDPNDSGALAEFLGMTFGEFANWFADGIVPERVKRVWTRR